MSFFFRKGKSDAEKNVVKAPPNNAPDREKKEYIAGQTAGKPQKGGTKQ